MEYFSLIDFICPNYLGSFETFRAIFCKPIHKGIFFVKKLEEKMKRKEQITEKDARQIDSLQKTAKLRAWSLHQKVSKLILRRGIRILAQKLPKRYEMVVKCKLSGSSHFPSFAFKQLEQLIFHYIFRYAI